MKNFRFTEHIFFLFGYLMTSVIFTLLDTSSLSLWLGFNVILAGIPYLTIMWVHKRFINQEGTLDIWNILLLIVFVLFLPNTFYIITDFIHISTLEFYQELTYGTTSYFEAIEPYILVTHILFSALIGIYYGSKSLLRLHEILKQIMKSKSLNTTIFIVILLSSIGIYIGRFLRLFSWDILNPFNVFDLFFNDLSVFSMWFIILFIIIQYACYFIFMLLFEEKRDTH
jgi:uncharacterized membrane protein